MIFIYNKKNELVCVDQFDFSFSRRRFTVKFSLIDVEKKENKFKVRRIRRRTRLTKGVQPIALSP